MSVTEGFMETNPQSETHVSDARLIRVQAWSGVIFSAFLLMHLMNQMVAAFGAEAYDRAQRALRAGYQWAPIEIAIVIAPLLVHVTSGVMRMLRRRQSDKKAPANLRARLHRWSGVVLLVFFAGHVIATRGASLIFHVYPEFAGIAFTLKWAPVYFWPYYLSFALAGMYHLVNGLGAALPILGVGEARTLRRPRFLVGVSVIAGVALVAAILGFGGLITKPSTDPRESPYAALLRRLGVAHDRAP